VYSYTEYLAEVDSGRLKNVPAPEIAIDYWSLAKDATLRDVIIAVRNDEAGHRDVNHEFADKYINAK
jgi:ubiquinol oxidase